MQRHERLEQDVKYALSNIIMNEVKEPSVTGLISVTDVNITPDQKYAKVYVSVFGKISVNKGGPFDLVLSCSFCIAVSG